MIVRILGYIKVQFQLATLFALLESYLVMITLLKSIPTWLDCTHGIHMLLLHHSTDLMRTIGIVNITNMWTIVHSLTRPFIVHHRTTQITAKYSLLCGWNSKTVRNLIIERHLIVPVLDVELVQNSTLWKVQRF